jgi:hypothetical protein
MTRKKLFVPSLLLCFLSGGLTVVALLHFCQPSGTVLPLAGNARADELPAQPTAPATPWLKGTPDEKFAQIERHLRGLDQAMAEIGFRYGELLIAGKTRNWEYAQYQTEKIELALRLAIERRPKRAKSSEPFLKESLPEVMGAIKAKDANKLDVSLDTLHTGCVECHKAEKVLYFKESVDRIKERSR